MEENRSRVCAICQQFANSGRGYGYPLQLWMFNDCSNGDCPVLAPPCQPPLPHRPFFCALSQMPEDLAHLDPETQQFHVKMRAAYLMTVGTALVLIFAGMQRGSPFCGRRPCITGPVWSHDLLLCSFVPAKETRLGRRGQPLMVCRVSLDNN